MDTSHDSGTETSNWEKAKALSAIFASVVIPLTLAMVGNWYASAVKDRELSVKYIELAIGILGQPPSDKNQGIRKWAIDVINQHADVKITDETYDEFLREKLSLPMMRMYDDAARAAIRKMDN